MESKQLSLLKIAAGALLALEILMVLAMLNPPDLKVVQSTYQASGSRAPVSPPPQGLPPQMPGFFAGIFRIEIPKRIVGQKLKFETVTFYQSEGKTIATLPIQYVQRYIKVQTVPVGGGPPQSSETSETVSGELWLYPFEQTEVSLGVGVSKVLKINSKKPLMARISGRSGLRTFEVVAKMKNTPLGIPAEATGP